MLTFIVLFLGIQYMAGPKVTGAQNTFFIALVV